MKSPKDIDGELGLGTNITRRDFLNATLIGTGGMLLASSTPLMAMAAPPVIKKDAWFGYGAVGDYAGASGNMRSVMEAGHRMRDGKYNSPAMAPADTGEVYDMVIVGGGLSGLSAAHYFKKNAAAGQKCLILENHAIF